MPMLGNRLEARHAESDSIIIRHRPFAKSIQTFACLIRARSVLEVTISVTHCLVEEVLSLQLMEIQDEDGFEPNPLYGARLGWAGLGWSGVYNMDSGRSSRVSCV